MRHAVRRFDDDKLNIWTGTLRVTDKRHQLTDSIAISDDF